jgi:hypothetical protein
MVNEEGSAQDSSAPTWRKMIAQGTALVLINIFSGVARRVSGAVKNHRK